MTHIYAFGSLVRGDVDINSDCDLLVVTDGFDDRFNPEIYSIYSYSRLRELWEEGNPFAWHLSMESVLLHSEGGDDFIEDLGKPTLYNNAISDCNKFFELFKRSQKVLEFGDETIGFELSTIFLSFRNFATCYSLGHTQKPTFARRAAKRISPYNLGISEETFSIFERARILSTRGKGEFLNNHEISIALNGIPAIESWMINLLTIMEKPNE